MMDSHTIIGQQELIRLSVLFFRSFLSEGQRSTFKDKHRSPLSCISTLVDQIKRVANRGARVLKVGVRAFLSVCERADPRMEVAASFDRGEGIAGF